MNKLTKHMIPLLLGTVVSFAGVADTKKTQDSFDPSILKIQKASLIGLDKPAEIIGINHPKRIDGRYIVVLKKDTVDQAINERKSLSSVPQFMSELISASESPSDIDFLRYYENTLYGMVLETSQESAIQSLLDNPAVDYIQVDYELNLENVQINPPSWGLDRVDQEDLPLNYEYDYQNRGGSVNVYVIDSGVNANHADFGSRILTDLDLYVDDNSGAIGDPPLCCTIPSVGDQNGHGTHVMGTIGGANYGVAKRVKFHSLKVFNSQGTGSTAGLLSALNWVRNNHVSPAVLNMSLGAVPSPALQTSIQALSDSGVIMVAAAGNQNGNSCAHWPSVYPGVISVASSDINDNRSGFSNFGSCVDIFAPGTDIISASHTSNSGSRTLSGTSMATPHVTGAIAQYLHQNPGANFNQVKTALINSATVGTLNNVGNNSPNRMLNIPSLMGVIDTYAADEFDDVTLRGFDDDVSGNAVQWPGSAPGYDSHNFHDLGDEDWTIVYFSGSAKFTAKAVGNNAATTMEVYKWISADPHPDGSNRFVNIVDEFIGQDMSSGDSEVVVHAHDAAVYAVRVKSYNNAYGEGTEYRLNLESLGTSTPDIYDNVPSQRPYNDDSEGQAVSWLGGDTMHVHNFHDAGDEDWTIVYFSGSAVFETVLYGNDADTTMEVYKWISADSHPSNDGRFINISHVPVGQDFSPGSSRVFVYAPEPAVYSIRVKSRGNVHGSTTTYGLRLQGN